VSDSEPEVLGIITAEGDQIVVMPEPIGFLHHDDNGELRPRIDYEVEELEVMQPPGGFEEE
jgi:hypothetical protein